MNNFHQGKVCWHTEVFLKSFNYKTFFNEIFTPFGNLTGFVIKEGRILFGPSTSAVGKQAVGGN